MVILMSEEPKDCSIPSIIVDTPEDDKSECDSLLASINLINYMTENEEELHSSHDSAPPNSTYETGGSG